MSRKTGVDDFIVARGVAAFKELLAHAEPLFPAEPLTDLGNAGRFARSAEGWFLYDPARKLWLAWTGTHWALDDLGRVREHAVETAREILAEAQREPGEDARKALTRHATKSQGRKAIEAMPALAPDVWSPLKINSSELDADPWLFNVENGTLDLRTGELRPHDPDDLITKLAPIAYDPAAPRELWDKIVKQILPDLAERAFLQRWLGYSLTGDVREEKLAFLLGSGRNGKGTIIETVLAAVGPYGCVAPESLLLATKNDNHPTELADLHGRRLVVANETGHGRKWNAARLKALTGGDRVKARHMREDFFEFQPTHKITVLSNSAPRADAEDLALWERLKVIPFERSFTDQPDTTLKTRLRAELPGVLAWLVEGCVAWQGPGGLGEPAKVKKATEEYRAEQRELDPLAPFMSSYHVDPKGRLLKEVVGDFNAFAPGRKLTSREAGDRLRALGYKVRRGAGGTRTVYPRAG